MYERFWRNKWLTLDATSIDDMIARYLDAVEDLRAMQQQGAMIDASGAADDYITLLTTDPRVAKEFGFSEMDDADVEDVEDDGNEDADRL